MVEASRVAESKLQIIATRGRVMGDYTQGGGTATRFESRIQVKTAPVYVRDVCLLYGNFLAGLGGDADSPNDITVESVVEVPAANYARRSFFGGNRTKLLSAGANLFVTDSIGMNLEASTDICVRTGVTVNAGQFVQYGVTSLTAADAFIESTSATSQVQGIGALTIPAGGASVTFGYGPLAVLGYPEIPTPACVIRGDSIAVGVDDVSTGNGALGFIERGLVAADSIPFANLARAGDSLQGMTAIGHGFRRDSIMDFATHYISNLGNNDPAGSVSLANMQAYVTTMWKAARGRGLKIWHCTIVPFTDSTDGWTTAEGQTVRTGYAADEQRGLFNDWLWTQVGGLIDGVIDVNAIVEDPANPGKWKIGLTDDGHHPNPACNLLMAPAVTAVAATWK